MNNCFRRSHQGGDDWSGWSLGAGESRIPGGMFRMEGGLTGQSRAMIFILVFLDIKASPPRVPNERLACI